MEEDKDSAFVDDDLFDKAEFMPSSSASPQEDEGFVKEIEQDGKRPEINIKKEEEGKTFKKKPVLMVNVENVVDEAYTQDQELKVQCFFF